MSGYLGSKEACWKRIAHEIPECDVLISPFAGQCALTRLMNPPRLRVVADRDPDVIDWWHSNEPGVMALQRNATAWLEELALNVFSQVVQSCPTRENFEQHAGRFAKWMGLAKGELGGLNDDGRVLLKVDGQWVQPLPLTTLPRERIRELLELATPQMAAWPAQRRTAAASPDWAALPTVVDWPQWWDKVVIYLDPPYLLSTRSHEGSVYPCDMTDADHVRLLRALRWLPCCVVISGYASPLYEKHLNGWRRIEFPVMSRGGPKTEVLWTNGPIPTLHQDKSQLGTNRREREKYARRDRRLSAKFERLPLGERLRLFHAVRSTLPPELAAAAVLELPRDPAAETGGVRSQCPGIVAGAGGARSHLEVASPEMAAAAGAATNGVARACRTRQPLLAVDGSREFSSASGGSSVTRDSSMSDRTRWGHAGNVTRDSAIGERARARHAGAGGVLSLYTGLGLLDRAFEERGFTVDSAGDLQFGKPIQSYRGRLHSHEGIIAGPPCQTWSSADPLRTPKSQVDFSATSTHEGVVTLRELLRVIDEVQPLWFLVECVPGVPDLVAGGYHVQRFNLTDVECGGTQRRLRSIQFGSREFSSATEGGRVTRDVAAACDAAAIHTPRDSTATIIRPARLTGCVPTEPAVLASRCRADEAAFERRCRTMGLEQIPDLSAFTKATRFRLVGNGVPLTMGRVLARAVCERGPVTDSDCVCGCGQIRQPGSQYSAASNAGCRKRVNRRKSERYFVGRPSPDLAAAHG